MCAARRCAAAAGAGRGCDRQRHGRERRGLRGPGPPPRCAPLEHPAKNSSCRLHQQGGPAPEPRGLAAAAIRQLLSRIAAAARGIRRPAARPSAWALRRAANGTDSSPRSQGSPAQLRCSLRTRHTQVTRSARRAAGGRWRGSTQRACTSSLRASCSSGEHRCSFKPWAHSAHAHDLLRCDLGVLRFEPWDVTVSIVSSAFLQLLHAPAACRLGHGDPSGAEARRGDAAPRHPIRGHFPDAPRCVCLRGVAERLLSSCAD